MIDAFRAFLVDAEYERAIEILHELSAKYTVHALSPGPSADSATTFSALAQTPPRVRPSHRLELVRSCAMHQGGCGH
jgi:hypothetical protein